MSWLVVVDLQPAFAHRDSPWFTPAVAEAAPRIAALVDKFGARSVFTRFVPPARPTGSWVGYYRRWPFALQPGADWLWAVESPWQNRPAISSHTFSKWTQKLRDRLGPEPTVVLCGVSTDCCVLMTALAALDDGAQVRVVADACAARTPGLHADALAAMARRAPQLEVLTAAEELARP